LIASARCTASLSAYFADILRGILGYVCWVRSHCIGSVFE
jgi:hypothetical protein